MRTKRFQNRITAGRFTLPTAIDFSILLDTDRCSVARDGDTAKRIFPLGNILRLLHPHLGKPSLQLYSVCRHQVFLIQLNNTFAIIRMRASVQTSVYFLLISVCPSLHMLYAGDLASASFLVALFFLFRSYQQARPTGSLFHAFVFIGLGSLLFRSSCCLSPSSG